jgi:hypothetical protein
VFGDNQHRRNKTIPGKKLPQILEKDLPISFTDKDITSFGRLALFARFCRVMGLGEALRECLPDFKRSNNSIDPIEIAMAFMVGVLRGATRFAHVA